MRDDGGDFGRASKVWANCQPNANTIKHVIKIGWLELEDNEIQPKRKRSWRRHTDLGK